MREGESALDGAGDTQPGVHGESRDGGQGTPRISLAPLSNPKRADTFPSSPLEQAIDDLATQGVARARDEADAEIVRAAYRRVLDELEHAERLVLLMATR